MGRHEQDSTKEDETFTVEWKHATRINWNHTNVGASIEHSEPIFFVASMGDQHSPPPSYTSNWTPLPRTTNITGTLTRTDSKDSFSEVSQL
ncbi:hypothetical protein DPMN_167511 [Dreissena polymorpha]|uniref:Uncharacterized protein n=1 Tax=Dreissena polymorpha TaxID=45954 RepID=A0A9D4IV41_DREPO|nr:hypothetical protein DPMN_167511 [Dreissena polymorpha]